MRYSVILFLSFCPLSINAQMSYPDSLRNIYFTTQIDSLKRKSLNLLAVHYMNNDLDSANHYAKLMLEYAKKFNKPRFFARAYTYQADIAAKQNDYSKHIELLSKVLEICEKWDDVDATPIINARLANAYVQINDFENAILRAKKALALSVNQDKSKYLYKEVISRANSALGEVYLKQKQYAESLPYFIIANKNSVKGNIIAWQIAKSYENLARAYGGLNKDSLAFKNYSSALKINIEINNISGAATCKEGLAGLLLKKNKLDSALINITQSEKLAIRLRDKNSLLKAYNQYIIVYNQRKDYKKMSEYLQLKLNLNDSINKIAFGKALANSKIKFETEEKERENVLLLEKTKVQHLQITNSRNQILLLVILVTSVIGVALFWFRFNKIKHKQKNSELEQKLLRSQMNPHFIFNALVSIQKFIYTNDAKTAGAFLSDFSGLMRLILENSSQEYITLTKEIDTLKYYLELQKLRSNNAFNYTIEVDANIDIEDALIPPMLAQPFIENSIEHGFQSLTEQGKLTIRFFIQNKHLVFELLDNGRGVQSTQSSSQKPSNHKSLATKITNERLGLMYVRKQKKVNFVINEMRDSLNNVLGTKVEFSIPYISQY